jgi:hypothetical protein
MIRFIIILLTFFPTLSVFADKKVLPSVQDIDSKNKNKFDISVYKCIAADEALKNLYMQDAIKILIHKKHNNAGTKCSEVEKSLQQVLYVQTEINSIARMPECMEDVDQKTISIDKIKETQSIISEKYNNVAQEYTQYFTYDANLANIEECIRFYDQLATVKSLNSQQEQRQAEFDYAKDVTLQNNLRGIYGDENGVKNLEETVYEINSKVITLKKISKYSVLEYEKQHWSLISAFDGKLVYTNGTTYIAFPMKKGISYSADSLPHSLFQIQKKVDIKKNRYSIFVVKPLI